MKYQSLMDGVAKRAALGSAEEARSACAAVVSTLAYELPERERQQLAQRLPGALEDAARVPGDQARQEGTSLLIQVAQRLSVSAERGRYLTQAVLSELQEQDRDLFEELREHLPGEALDVLADAGTSPGQATSVRSEMPTRLSGEEVQRALHRLDNWSGDERGISRTVALPDERLTPLINRVEREAREMNDHAHVRRDEDAVTFTLRTDSSGVVTQPDIWLAERIDRAVAETGSGG